MNPRARLVSCEALWLLHQPRRVHDRGGCLASRWRRARNDARLGRLRQGRAAEVAGVRIVTAPVPGGPGRCDARTAPGSDLASNVRDSSHGGCQYQGLGEEVHTPPHTCEKLRPIAGACVASRNLHAARTWPSVATVRQDVEIALVAPLRRAKSIASQMRSSRFGECPPSALTASGRWRRTNDF